MARKRKPRTTVEKERFNELLRKERYFDNVLSASGTYTTSEIAALVGTSAVSLNKLLESRQIIKKEGDFWVLRAKYVGKGYIKTPTVIISDENGDMHTKIVTRWTEAGRAFIWGLLNEPEEDT